jgi:transcriptional regulator with XRE-family HTH domain
MNLGEKIREKRKRMKMTQKTLSELSGISVTFISDIEKERTFPSIPTLLKICESLDLPPYLLFLDEKSTQVMEHGLNYSALEPYLKDYDAWPTEDKEDLVKYLNYKLSSMKHTEEDTKKK